VLSVNSWCVDNGATNHVCNTFQGFQQTKQLSHWEIYIHTGNNTKVSTVAVGDLELFFINRILILKDYLYIPSIRRKMVLVFSLVQFGYYVYFDY